MDRLPNRDILGKIPRFSPKIEVGTHGEDIFGDYWGTIGDGDRLEIREFLEKLAKIPQKLGWGWGRHFWGILGTIWGQGQNS